MHPPSGPERLSPRRSYLLLLGVIWLTIVAILVGFRSALLPFAGALLVAYVIAPLVGRLSSISLGRGRHYPRWASIMTLYAALFAVLYLFIVSAVPQLYREAVRVTVELRDGLNRLTPDQIAAWVRDGERWLDTHGIPIDLGEGAPPVEDGHLAAPGPAGLVTGSHTAAPGAKITVDLANALEQALSSVSSFFRTHFLDLVGYSRAVLEGVASGLFVFLFVLTVAAFVLIEPRRLLDAFRAIVPVYWRGDFDQILVRIDDKLAGVVRGQLLICVLNGTLTLVGLLLLKVKFALLLASIATVLSFIPIFGSVVSTIPIVLVGVTQSWQTGVLALGWILFIHGLEAYFLNPKIMGTAAKIHPAFIAVALLVGERTWGLTGALFAVPVASILLATMAHVRDRAHSLEPAVTAPEPVRAEPEPETGPRSV